MTLAVRVRIHNTRDHSIREVTVARFPVRLGRDRFNDVVIDRPYVASFHATLELSEGKLLLRDLGARNGLLLRRKGRVTQNGTVDLEDAAYEFAIVDHVFTVSPINVGPN